MLPQKSVTLVLSDQDLRDLVAESLDKEILQTSIYGHDVEIRVDGIAGQPEGWKIDFVCIVTEWEKE